MKSLADILQMEIAIGQFHDAFRWFTFQCQAQNTVIRSDKISTAMFDQDRSASTADPRVDDNDVNGAGGKVAYANAARIKAPAMTFCAGTP